MLNNIVVVLIGLIKMHAEQHNKAPLYSATNKRCQNQIFTKEWLKAIEHYPQLI
jgi:hypothetical protein